MKLHVNRISPDGAAIPRQCDEKQPRHATVEQSLHESIQLGDEEVSSAGSDVGGWSD